MAVRMLRAERQEMDGMKSDKTFAHWLPVLRVVHEGDANAPSPRRVWRETDGMFSRLKSVDDLREEELELVCDDLLGRYGDEDYVTIILTVFATRLSNAFASCEDLKTHPYRHLMMTLDSMLRGKWLASRLMDAYFGRDTDARGEKVVIPVCDELANAEDVIYDEEIKRDNNMDKEEKMNIARGMFEGADLSHAQIIAFAESGSKIVNQETIVNDEHQKHFPYLNSFDKGIRLFNMLVEGEFISKETESNSFLFLMGCSNEEPENLKPIMWMKTKQLLREMLEGAYRVPIENGSVTKAELEQLVPLCFVDKNGEELNLAKPKAVPSHESDKLSKFFATFSDLNSKD